MSDFANKYSYHKIPEYFAGYFDYDALMKFLAPVSKKLPGVYIQTSTGNIRKAVRNDMGEMQAVLVGGYNEDPIDELNEIIDNLTGEYMRANTMK